MSEIFGNLETLLEPNALIYLDEIKKSYASKCHRCSIILMWNIFISELYDKIDFLGISEFIDKLKESTKYEKVYSKKDLNKIKDIDVIIVCYKLSFFNFEEKKELENLCDIRNSASHVNNADFSDSKTNYYIEYIIKYIKKIKDLDIDTSEKKHINSIITNKEYNITKIEATISSMDYLKLKRLIKEIINKVKFYSYEDESDSNKKKLIYILCKVCVIRTKIDEKIELLKMIILGITNYHIEHNFEIKNTIIDVIKNKSEIKEFVVTDTDILSSFLIWLKNSRNFYEANNNLILIENIFNHLENSKEYFNKIVKIAENNNQVEDSFNYNYFINKYKDY